MEWADILKTLITAVSSVVVALVTAGYFRKNAEKNKESKGREKLMEQIQKDELVHFTLREIRRKFNSDRVYIIQFHNGGSFYTQTPMQKASITYERCSDGLEKFSERFQNILILIVILIFECKFTLSIQRLQVLSRLITRQSIIYFYSI